VTSDEEATKTPLSVVEFTALKQLSKSFARGTIINDIRTRLIKLGYAKDFMSNLIITDEGLLRLALGNGDQE
jgi:hypothetical protein